MYTHLHIYIHTYVNTCTERKTKEKGISTTDEEKYIGNIKASECSVTGFYIPVLRLGVVPSLRTQPGPKFKNALLQFLALV